MISKSILAASVAGGIVAPTHSGVILPPKLEIARQAIVRPENIEFSKNLLLGMPLTMGTLANRAAPASINLRNTATSATTTGTQTTYTYNNISIGTADTSRLVFAHILGYNGSTGGRTLSSCTIGGVSATIIQQGTSGSGLSFVTALAVARVPTGTTATVSFSFSNSMNQARCFVSSVNNIISSTPISTSLVALNGLTSATTSSLTFPANGFVIAYEANDASNTNTWTNVTEWRDGVLNTSFYASAADEFPIITSTSTITVVPSAAYLRGNLIAATFR